MIEAIDHIGIAVESLETAIEKYETAFNLKCEKIEAVESEKVRVAFFTLGESRIELLEPTSDDSPIRRFIEKRGEGIHHIAFRSNDLENDLTTASEAGCSMIGNAPRSGSGESSVAFLHPKSLFGSLIELCSPH